MRMNFIGYGATPNNFHNICVLLRSKGVLREFKKGRYYSSSDYRVVVDFPGHLGYESYYSKLEKVFLMRFEVSVMDFMGLGGQNG